MTVTASEGRCRFGGVEVVCDGASGSTVLKIDRPSPVPKVTLPSVAAARRFAIQQRRVPGSIALSANIDEAVRWAVSWHEEARDGG